MAYVSNILWYVNSKRESVPSWISVKFYNWDTFLSEVKLNVWDVVPQSSIPTVSSSDIYYSWTLWTYMDDSDPLRREKYTPTWSWFTLNWEAFDLTQPIKDNVRLVANVTSTTEYATKLTTVLMGDWSSTTTSDLWYIYTPSWTSISYQTFKDANISIDFSQYWPYNDTASYTIWSNGSNNPFDPSYVWTDAWQSSTIFRSNNVNANVIVYIVQMTSATVTFTEYSGTNFVIWSDSTISIPKGSYCMTPELNNVQTPVNIPFKYTHYDTPLTVKTVTLSPITSSGYSPYIYWIGIDTANFPSAENLEIKIFVDRTIVAFGWGLAPTRVLLDCTHWAFKDTNDIAYCGQYNICDLIHINRNSSSQSLSRIYMHQYYWGAEANIVTIEPEEWYRVKWVDIYDTSWEFTERVDNNNTSASARSWKIMPYVVEYHWYPYYGFDSNWSNNDPHLWWDWWMYSNNTFTDYVKNMVNNLAWFTPSYISSMYWSSNEIFYVEWLDNQWNVVTNKIYCYMYSGFYNSQTSTVADIYFVVDITSYNTLHYNYSSVYPSTITYVSKADLWSAIMNDIMWWNCVWWAMSYNNTYDFSNSAARNLYQTDSSKYNSKFNFYNNLKESANSSYSWITLI